MASYHTTRLVQHLSVALRLFLPFPARQNPTSCVTDVIFGDAYFFSSQMHECYSLSPIDTIGIVEDRITQVCVQKKAVFAT
jgi:hypothetical protein